MRAKLICRIHSAQRDRSASTASHLTDGDDLIGNLLSIDVDANETAAEELPSNIARTTAGRLRLRELLLVKHQALFFTGSAYFNLGKFPDEENEAYSAAEHLRTTITTPYERMVLKARRKLKASMEARVEKDAKSEKPFVFDLDAFEVRFVPLKNRPGLTTREVFARIEETTNALNGCQSFFSLLAAPLSTRSASLLAAPLSNRSASKLTLSCDRCGIDLASERYGSPDRPLRRFERSRWAGRWRGVRSEGGIAGAR